MRAAGHPLRTSPDPFLALAGHLAGERSCWIASPSRDAVEKRV